MRGIHYNRHDGTYIPVFGCGKVIATAEMCNGNETVGTTWIETKSFDKNAPVSEILLWAHTLGVAGKVIITPDLGTEIQEAPDGKDRD